LINFIIFVYHFLQHLYSFLVWWERNFHFIYFWFYFAFN